MSPQLLARIGGVLYLIIIAGGIFGELIVREGLIVSGDAARRAANIKGQELLWRFGVAVELSMVVLAIPLALIFLLLLRPVNRHLAWLAVFFNLVSISFEATNELRLANALLPLGDAQNLGAIGQNQLSALSGLSVEAYENGFAATLIFFGCVCLCLGYLIFYSGSFRRSSAS